MARSPVWIRWFPKDALDGMAQLAPMEELAYRRILDLIITTGDALLDDDRALAWMTKTGRQWRAVKDRLIALGKIEAADGFIRNARATASCVDTERFVAQKVDAANARHGRRKSLKTPETAHADASPSAHAGAPAPDMPSNIQQEDSSLRSESARPADRAPVQGALILPMTGGGEPIPSDEGLGERVRREQGGEARRILRALAPALAPVRMGEMLGTWCKHLGGDRAALLHVLRDAESHAAAEKIVGDPIRWLWGLVRQRATTINHPGASHVSDHHPAERRTYGAGGSGEGFRAAVAAIPELAGRLEAD